MMTHKVHSLNHTPSIYSCLLQGVRNRESSSAEVVEAYKYTFSQPGALTGPINYYRCIHLAQQDMKAFVNRKIDVPTLIIWVSNLWVTLIN